MTEFIKRKKNSDTIGKNNSSFFPKAQIFPKLQINTPGDAYEQEADAMAEKISRMPESGIQRKCTDCEEEESLQMKEQSSPNLPSISRKSDSGGMKAPAGLSTQLQTSKGGGNTLPTRTKTQMSHAFSRDFSQVRIHNGDQAANMSQQIQAKAFTHGSDIFFNKGQYQPGTKSGDKLLAHELTHVVQQQQQPGIQRQICSVGPSQMPKDRLDSFNSSFTIDPAKLTEFNKKTILELAREVRRCESKAYQKDFGKAMTAVYGTEGTGIWTMSGKTLAGYNISGYDFDNRFFDYDSRLGLEKSKGHSKLKSVDLHYWEWDKNKNETVDPAEKAELDKLQKEKKKAFKSAAKLAEKSFSDSDMLVFSGHQFARYQAPGAFSNDPMDQSMDLRYLKGKSFTKVKLIVSTGCATICKEAAELFTSLFPDALFLGYRDTAPGNGRTLSKKFRQRLEKIGQPMFLEESSDLDKIKLEWKVLVQSMHPGNDGKKRQPGWIYKGKGQFWDGKHWQDITNISDASNACRSKGDETTEFPAP